MHVCVRFSVCVQVEALRQADHPSKESYQLRKTALCSKVGARYQAGARGGGKNIGGHSGTYSRYSRLRRDEVQRSKWVTPFPRNLLPPSSGFKMVLLVTVLFTIDVDDKQATVLGPCPEIIFP
jgi:hypothetical protein